MPTDNAISNAILAQTIDLTRLESGLRAEVVKILKRMQKELTAKLAGEDLTLFGRQSANRLYKDAGKVIAAYYAQAGSVLDAPELADITAKATSRAMTEAFGGALAVQLPKVAYLATLASDALIDGAPSAAWWDKQSADMTFRFSSAVRQGLAQAETNTQIINRVREATGIAQRNAAALVQTSVQAVANQARMATFEANSDIIAAVRWLATLDARVCPQCAALDGLEWKLDGTPIKHGVAYQTPPRHWNDRCAMVPRTKTYKELGLDIDEIPQAPRAAAGGPFQGNFDDWLRHKGPEYQDEVFGPGRADLYRRGVITRSQLLDQNGNPLTLKQLREKYQ